MTQFYDALKALVNPELIAKASSILDEKQANVSKAVSYIIPSILGVMLKKGNTPQIRETFEEAGNLNILAEVKSLWDNDLTHDQQRIGDNFLQNLLGDKAADFTAPVSENSGISKVATNKLVSMIAPIAVGFFGNKLTKENYSLHSILNQIDKEKNHFEGFIPSGIISAFGLSSVLKSNANTSTQKKSNNNWILWVAAILVILLLFLWWRSCRDRTDSEGIYVEEIAVTDTISQGMPIVPADRTDSIRMQREKAELTLPGGTKLQAYKGGVEDEMIKFLNSDKYKNANDDELKKHWFEFDNIAFAFGSPTELSAESESQLNNIVSVLKAYPNTKIKIGGFADKKGTEEANMEISKERAKTIESILDKKGVGSQIVKTEGYGDEYAKHSANASDAQRAEDRDIALRFVK